MTDGVSPAYVQQQLGHSSIKLTVDTYGRWLPQNNPAHVDRLDETPLPREVVAAASAEERKQTASLPLRKPW